MMNGQKSVAWDELPTRHPEAGSRGSSAASSKPGRLEEEKPEILLKAPETESTLDMTLVPNINIPHSITNVLYKIETARMERERKDISEKLLNIQENVNRLYARYEREDGFDPDVEKEYLRIATLEEKSRRSNLLRKVNDQSAFKEKELEMVLE